MNFLPAPAIAINSKKEFELQPTGSGNVKATITVTPPQPGAQPKTSIYEFKVK